MEQSIVIRSPHLTLNEKQERLIVRLGEKLERFYPRVVGCEVSIEPPPPQRRKGRSYSVRVDVRVPGSDLHIREESPVLETAVRSAFDIAKRRLEDFSQLQRHAVKRHEPGPREIQV